MVCSDFSDSLSRSGAASLLVLGVLTACVTLLAGSQISLRNRAIDLRIAQAGHTMRAAAVLGLREGMALLAEDTLPGIDDPREEWGQPLRFRSSDGVSVWVQVSDAQDRLNINHLSLPVSPTMIRTPETMFSELIEMKGFEPESETISSLAQEMREEELELQDPLQILSLVPEIMEGYPFIGDHLSALPRRESGFIPVNLNSVQPEVLLAILGTQFQGWVERVVTARESAPIPSIESVFSGMPGIIQPVLPRVLSVQSDYFRIRVLCEIDSIQRETIALVQQSSTGDVEIIRCQW